MTTLYDRDGVYYLDVLMFRSLDARAVPTVLSLDSTFAIHDHVVDCCEDGCRCVFHSPNHPVESVIIRCLMNGEEW